MEAIQAKQEKLIQLFRSAPIVQSFGLQLSYRDGSAVIDMPYNPNYDHGYHQIHGGVMATLLDTAGWFTVAPHFDFWIATVEFSTRLLIPAEKEALRACGKIVRLGKRLAFCDMEVKNSREQLVAVGSGTFSATSVPAKW